MSNLRHAAAALGAVGLMLASALPAGAAAPKKVRVPNLYGRSVPRAEYMLQLTRSIEFGVFAERSDG